MPRSPEAANVEDVHYEVGDGIARITIDRPERRNAMSFTVMEGLRESTETRDRHR